MRRVAIRGLLLFVVSALIVGLSPLKAAAERRIGVLQFTDAPRYEESRRGILDQLREEGFGKPAAKFDIQNAMGSKARAVAAAQKFAAEKVDLIVTIGTHATLAATTTTREVPIVFSTVYDPVEVGIANDWKSSGNNTTGSSTKIPMSMVISVLNELAPVKRLAVLYTPGEKNSEAQLMELQKVQADFRIKIIPVILGKKEEVPQALSEVVPAVDAIYLTGSSIVTATLAQIVEVANRRKVITITHLDDLVEGGALLGVGVNSYLVGRLAGAKAAKILKGTRPAAIPIEAEKKLDIILNRKTAKAGKFSLPPHFMKKVTRVIE